MYEQPYKLHMLPPYLRMVQLEIYALKAFPFGSESLKCLL